MKVFGNVRAKDLCYRMNSNILKGATIGERQELAAACGGEKKTVSSKKRKVTKKQKPAKKRKCVDGATSVRVRMQGCLVSAKP